MAASSKCLHNIVHVLDIMLIRSAGLLASFIVVVIAFSYNFYLVSFNFGRSCDGGLRAWNGQLSASRDAASLATFCQSLQGALSLIFSASVLIDNWPIHLRISVSIIYNFRFRQCKLPPRGVI